MVDLQHPDLLALIGQDTPLRRVAGTGGGEYAGPCPFCGGTDRLRVQPARQRWWCRQCSPGTRWHDAIAYVMRRDNFGFKEACAQLEGLGVAVQPASPAPPPTPRPLEAPGTDWQARARALCAEAQAALWGADGRPLAWLRQRGLRDDTIRAAGLGYQPEDRADDPALWGLDPAHYERVWIPRGIVIPWQVDGDLWKITVRRPPSACERGDKYIALPGSANALYGADTLRPGQPAVLTEGVFDALAVRQEAGDLVAAVASGTTWARRFRWIARLALCSRVLLAHDHDGAQKGEAAARYWREVLGSKALRWRPYLKDIGDMLEHGFGIRAWVEAGLALASEEA